VQVLSSTFHRAAGGKTIRSQHGGAKRRQRRQRHGDDFAQIADLFGELARRACRSSSGSIAASLMS
jgi:hypothetical protein